MKSADIPLSVEAQLELAANDILANSGDRALNKDMSYSEVFYMFESIDGDSLRGPPNGRSYEPVKTEPPKANTCSKYPCPQCGGQKSKYSDHASAICKKCYMENARTNAVKNKTNIQKRKDAYSERFSYVGFWINYWLDFKKSHHDIDEWIDRITSEETQCGVPFALWDIFLPIEEGGFSRIYMPSDKYAQMTDGFSPANRHKRKRLTRLIRQSDGWTFATKARPRFYVDEHSWPAKHAEKVDE